MNIPNFITHYNRSEPFQSVSGVAKERLSEVLSGLSESNSWGLARFSHPEYLKRRLVVEQKVRKEFLGVGGKPVLKHPIYFFLVRNVEFERDERNRGYVILLEDLPKDVVSFTYGDSMFSLNEDYRVLKGQGYLSDLCTQIFKVEDLPRVCSHEDYVSPMGLHIEAQLWISPSEMMFRQLNRG